VAAPASAGILLVSALPRRPLGRTGLDVSLLGLGTVKLGRNTDVKYPHAFRLPDDEAARRLLDRARDLGVNLLDTAPAYGESEERLGRLLQGRRNDFVLCTKTGEEYDPRTGSRYDFTPEHTRVSVARSLKRLRTDVIDVVLVHSDGHDDDVLGLGTLEALEDLRRAGWIRAIGFSGKTVHGGLAAAERCDVVMVTLSAAYRDELPVVAAARDRGCGVLVKKALGSGHAVATDALSWVAAHEGGEQYRRRHRRSRAPADQLRGPRPMSAGPRLAPRSFR
jgi:aryl-alcohol dehydrogenase-like predicted oxidoreductase